MRSKQRLLTVFFCEVVGNQTRSKIEKQSRQELGPSYSYEWNKSRLFVSGPLLPLEHKYHEKITGVIAQVVKALRDSEGMANHHDYSITYYKEEKKLS